MAPELWAITMLPKPRGNVSSSPKPSTAARRTLPRPRETGSGDRTSPLLLGQGNFRVPRPFHRDGEGGNGQGILPSGQVPKDPVAKALLPSGLELPLIHSAVRRGKGDGLPLLNAIGILQNVSPRLFLLPGERWASGTEPLRR